ncbi:MAG: hypothetical protein EXQ58_12540, partial [Acidobacteria bacterium]|nr:hypothetical protein [Acidobacteriota bacterium]
MFLRNTERKKDGKVHHYYSGVENRRVTHHKVTQRTVLYLGEINQLQETAWMDQLLAEDFAVASKDRLYRCLDRLLPHKQELFGHLKQRWQTLFRAQFELLLYDLTST